MGERGIPLRGSWNNTDQEEVGNFIHFVKWKAEYDNNLKEHLQNAKDNAKYTSPKIQNEIITLCETNIRNKIKQCMPKYWSLLADETTDCATMEQVSVFARFVNEFHEVCEEFLGFRKVSEMNANAITTALLTAIEEWGLKDLEMVGQGYDGASLMSSSKNGVQRKIKGQFPNALYVHRAVTRS